MKSLARPARRVLASRTGTELFNVRPILAIRSAQRGVATIQQTRPVKQSSWTTSRALLLASFSASLAYLLGAYDVSSLMESKQEKVTSVATPYANREDLEKVD